ncbi:MAG: hypothetical protein CL477_12595 [Acidobacteria bacterium]|jgi:hypothetical protein|nr:hypothetical protein [Acidobacteriota bacterium]HJN44522.1 hypothetical protein [Vicinamibacterales bacterium]|tara:strand:- start:538 stop:1125 length:588 start_codon:yes stop_codon:yes gene_type:complete
MTQGIHEFSMLQRRKGHDEMATAVDDDIPSNAIAEVIQQRQGYDEIATAVVVDITPEGIAKVILGGETDSCDASSLLQFASSAEATEALLGRTVLVLADRQTPPVILGVVAQRLWEEQAENGAREAHVQLPVGEARSVQLDKRRVDLEATDQIRLTCGKSSLVLRRDGTVIVRGVKVVSRASQSNKIRGATVSIN